jgi:deazaflavin-dependent oxidoreductase (nitroreductase family)
MPEPFAARLHFITRVTDRLQTYVIIKVFRRYFERAPGWLLLTTRGRKTGLPREVLLPCERFREGLIIISTYGRRSNWIRNLEGDSAVTVICGGWALPARAEIIDDVKTKRSLVSAHPFFPPAPVFPINTIHVTLLRPITIALLRWWVTSRPVVLIRLALPSSAQAVSA